MEMDSANHASAGCLALKEDETNYFPTFFLRFKWT